MIYLACPYSDTDPTVRQDRFEKVNKVAAALMAGGTHVFSPISHTHPIALHENPPKGWDFWEEYDIKFLNMCSMMHVLMLPGWKESKCVQAEIKIMQKLGKPIVYLETE